MMRFSLVGQHFPIAAEIAAFLEEQRFIPDSSAPEIVIAVVRAHDHEQHREAQRVAHRIKAAFLPVLLGPAEITIGPATPPHGSACIGCFHLWTMSRWTNAERDAQAVTAIEDFCVAAKRQLIRGANHRGRDRAHVCTA